VPVGGFLGALPDSPLVARDAEMERLLAALDCAVQGDGRLVLLAGEPGIGKTRLAQEVMVAARERGFCLSPSGAMTLHQIDLDGLTPTHPELRPPVYH